MCTHTHVGHCESTRASRNGRLPETWREVAAGASTSQSHVCSCSCTTQAAHGPISRSVLIPTTDRHMEPHMCHGCQSCHRAHHTCALRAYAATCSTYPFCCKGWCPWQLCHSLALTLPCTWCLHAWASLSADILGHPRAGKHNSISSRTSTYLQPRTNTHSTHKACTCTRL